MIVVTGATGNVGRPLVEALHAGAEEVVAVSRTITEADVPTGMRFQRADLFDAQSLVPALQRARALFMVTPADFHAAGEEAFAAVMDVAQHSRLRQVVLLSSLGVAAGRHPSGLEQALKRTSLSWTVLRPGGFHTNALWWAGLIRSHRLVAAPFGDVALPSIDPGDIAAVASVTLREDGHQGQVYRLTGPAPITPRQQTEAIGAVLGEPVSFVEQSRAEAKAQMLQYMPETVVERTLDALSTPTDIERNVSLDVDRILGRPPRSFREWASSHVAAFK
ncbi:NAD(P)H-binding protein [Mycobacterium vicinigordonae]|uniref:NAD(P)H-binding protein n=1 Tax=Mycobacterium vicinigordonae TaxID=1719132 RepID=A0A7D6HVI3_9MYCO|nr:NAD(P)H-binding protein [Mycobacterium vicinigordonae]QLL05335.1 NAD(P)H-binding protein [Mycobacterium vicinigordonae]